MLVPARARSAKATTADGSPLSNASAIPGSESPPDGHPRARSATAGVGHYLRTTGSSSANDRVDDHLGRAPGVITLTQPKIPEAKIRGSQKGFQWVILGLERAEGVRKRVQRGLVGPMRPPKLAALPFCFCSARVAPRRGGCSRRGAIAWAMAPM
jgi:hypothetical protein